MTMSHLAQVQQRVAQTLDGCGVRPGDRILAACSGGPDSLTLLHVLATLQSEHNWALGVVHIHHGLRPEAEAEAQRTERLAMSWGLPVWVERADVPAWRREHGGSVEMAARAMRHSLLRRRADEWRADWIALGHTADDRAETLLLNLLRGSGISGLAALPPRAGRLIRPLITCTRLETRAYCESAGLAPIEDPSNQDMHFQRNRLRLQALPLLQAIEPQVKRHLLQLAEIAQAEEAFWEEHAVERWPHLCAAEGAGFARLNRRRLLMEPLAAQRRLLRFALTRVRGHLEDIEWRHIEAMRTVARAQEGSATINLPGGLIFRREQRHLYLGPVSGPVQTCLETPLPYSGVIRIAGRLWRVSRLSCPPDWRPRPPRDPMTARLDDARLVGSLRVRSRRPGDRFQPLGAPGRKSLQDYFTDRKVPRSQRDDVPLLIDDEGILWVVGYDIAHRARVQADTASVVEIHLE